MIHYHQSYNSNLNDADQWTGVTFALRNQLPALGARSALYYSFCRSQVPVRRRVFSAGGRR
jgi:hypothetical protein